MRTCEQTAAIIRKYANIELFVVVGSGGVIVLVVLMVMVVVA